MNDPLFLDPRLTELVDCVASWETRPAYGFYMPLMMSAKSVLDVGCGTGELLRLARKNRHTGRLCGVDPAEPMLRQARKQTDIEWVLGDAAAGGWDAEFDLVIMTGHATQVILDLDEIRSSLDAIRSALADQGRFGRPGAERAAETAGGGEAEVRIQTSARDAETRR
jgi:SAM-dependent methyltransferase